MEDQSEQVKNLLYSVNDLERIGDHAENIAELAESKIQGDIQFSEMGQEDLKEMFECAIGAVRMRWKPEEAAVSRQSDR